jgi:hypothetical protein
VQVLKGAVLHLEGKVCTFFALSSFAANLHTTLSHSRSHNIVENEKVHIHWNALKEQEQWNDANIEFVCGSKVFHGWEPGSTTRSRRKVRDVSYNFNFLNHPQQWRECEP